jgi:hypothetical protein
MTFKCDAIVLLGVSGAGKDTIAQRLLQDYNQLKLVKFSALPKLIVASLFKATVENLENKEWRTTQKLELGDYSFSVTPFDLLTSLFKGSHGTALATAQIEYALNNIGDGNIPVFTDTRRKQEFDEVCKLFNPIVIYLSRTDLDPGVNDGELEILWNSALLKAPNAVRLVVNKGEPVEKTYARVVGAVEQSVVHKPTLTILVSRNSRAAVEAACSLPGMTYEPLDALAGSIAAVCKKHNIDDDSFHSMFNAALDGMNFSQVNITSINQDSTMVWNREHEYFLPQLRAMARLLVHPLDADSLDYCKSTFDSKEL